MLGRGFLDLDGQEASIGIPSFLGLGPPVWGYQDPPGTRIKTKLSVLIMIVALISE